MKPGRGRWNRILSVQPTSRGFGFALIDVASDQVVAYGVQRVRPPVEVEQRALPKVAELIEHSAPDVVIVEDTTHRQSRRQGHPKAIIEGITEVAEVLRVPVCAVPGVDVRQHFRSLRAVKKDQVAALIANRFVDLRSVLPPPRKIWRREDDRMAIFDAVAFAIVSVERSTMRA